MIIIYKILQKKITQNEEQIDFTNCGNDISVRLFRFCKLFRFLRFNEIGLERI